MTKLSPLDWTQIKMQPSGIKLLDEKSLDSVIKNMFEHQIIVKMYHFQTERYGPHKVSDSYLCKFCINFDHLMEVLQGIYGKINTSELELNKISTCNDNTIKNKLENFKTTLVNYKKETFNEHDGVCAILDMMIADVDQFVYLLKFQ